MINKEKIAVVGLGYVGLPLAVEFGKKNDTIGYDISEKRIKELIDGQDSTLETTEEDIKQATNLSFTHESEDIRNCDIYIVTVPTPIDKHKQPDLSLLENSSETIGKLLQPGNIVIYESTVYPGATEEVCAPILEKASGLKYANTDNLQTKTDYFFLGYSPERINPGDKKHSLSNVIKITSGSTTEIAEKIDKLYQTIIKAGTHKVSSIKVAEAAKVIENTQRDVNIALVNELALIFNRLDIDTEEVLNAAGSKWNFLPFKPGLVGGHCIGVDPYYLTHKATELGYNPEMILAGRRLNDNMGNYIADQVIKLMTKKNIHVVGSNVLIMGFTFKENCTDYRNTRVIDMVEELKNFNCKVDVFDPWVEKESVTVEYNIDLIDHPLEKHYDAIILAVAHDDFVKIGTEQIKSYGKDKHIIYDVKSILNAEITDCRL
jgi:nucleotide sugar dehydrogenase